MYTYIYVVIINIFMIRYGYKILYTDMFSVYELFFVVFSSPSAAGLKT